MTGEDWRPVAEAPGYDVSNLGRVRSWRNGGTVSGVRSTPRVLKPQPIPAGHLHVFLRIDGATHPRYVHRLVLTAFVGPCPAGMEACHADGDPTNNQLRNLRWDTRSANTWDRVAHGTHVAGERHWRAVLTWKDVDDIRALASAGVPRGIIASRFPATTRSNISAIIRHESWNRSSE